MILWVPVLGKNDARGDHGTSKVAIMGPQENNSVSSFCTVLLGWQHGNISVYCYVCVSAPSACQAIIIHYKEVSNVNVLAAFTTRHSTMVLNQHRALVVLEDDVLFGTTALLNPEVSIPNILWQFLTDGNDFRFGGTESI